MQQKAQDEIDSVIGQERLPSYEDRPRLPFCEAFSKEMLRWRPVATLGACTCVLLSVKHSSSAFTTGIPHATTEDDVYEGYFIPKGTLHLICQKHVVSLSCRLPCLCEFLVCSPTLDLLRTVLIGETSTGPSCIILSTTQIQKRFVQSAS